MADVLEIARGELGNTESPAGSNRTRYGRWYGMDGYAWCAFYLNMAKSDHREGGITYESAKTGAFERCPEITENPSI